MSIRGTRVGIPVWNSVGEGGLFPVYDQLGWIICFTVISLFFVTGVGLGVHTCMDAKQGMRIYSGA